MNRYSLPGLLSLAALLSCSASAQPVAATGPGAAVLQNAMRAEWNEQMFWSREMTRAQLADNERALEVASEQAQIHTRELAALFVPYYGGADAGELRRLLQVYYEALNRYARSLEEDDASRIRAAKDWLNECSNALARWVAGVNPELSLPDMRAVLAVHTRYQSAQAEQLLKAEYEKEAQTWQLMRDNLHALSDALVIGLTRQFPDRFAAQGRWPSG